jgi:hypothetical protein
MGSKAGFCQLIAKKTTVRPVSDTLSAAKKPPLAAKQCWLLAAGRT